MKTGRLPLFVAKLPCSCHSADAARDPSRQLVSFCGFVAAPPDRLRQPVIGAMRGGMAVDDEQ
jgi:hypothetical protein